MGQGSQIRRHTRKVITLEHMTAKARAEGTLENDEPITVIIRKVSALDLTRRLGAPPILISLAGLKGDEREARLDEINADPETKAQMVNFGSDMIRYGLVEGIVSPTFRLAVVDPDDLTPEDLGDDMIPVWNAIAQFSGLPDAMMMGGKPPTFPAGTDSAAAQPDSPLLRDEPDRAAEPVAG